MEKNGPRQNILHSERCTFIGLTVRLLYIATYESTLQFIAIAGEKKKD